MKNKFIHSYCTIRNGQIFLNNKLVFSSDQTDVKLVLKEAYRFLEIKYSKFFKMDSLSELAFIGAELLTKSTTDLDENTAVVLSNNASSLDTDRVHQESINNSDNYYPSPAVFVYTLPNICIGEISIRHKLKSENAFFIFENYNSDFHFNYERSLMDSQICSKVLGGWVDMDNEKYDVFMYLISDEGKLEHTSENLKRLYKK